jgi:hypothetical protein
VDGRAREWRYLGAFGCVGVAGMKGVKYGDDVWNG